MGVKFGSTFGTLFLPAGKASFRRGVRGKSVWTQSSISCWRDNQSPIYDLFSIVSWSFGGWVEKWGWFGDNAVGGFPAACHFPPYKTEVFIIYPQIQAQKARGKVS